MDRIFNPDQTNDDRRFTEGDDVTDVDATPLDQKWLNDVQDELCNAATMDGDALDANNQEQLKAVIARRTTQADVQEGAFSRSVNVGNADSLAGDFIPPVMTLTDGLTLQLLCLQTNTQPAVGFTPHSGHVPGKGVVKAQGEALQAGDIPVGWADFRYSQTLDKWQLLNPASTPSNCKVEVYTTTGTWTKAPGAKSIHLLLIGSGAGGDSGAVTAPGIAASGGDSGGGGAVFMGTFDASVIPASLAIAVGREGVGGAPSSTSTKNPGTKGNDTNFGLVAVAKGASNSFSPGLSYTPGMFTGAPRVRANVGGGASVSRDALSVTGGAFATGMPPGSSGAGISGADVVASSNGFNYFSLMYNATGYTPGAGNHGSDATCYLNGRSGAGGGASATANGTDGGDGGKYGCGGGGGGAARPPFMSGKGGDGGPGIAVVTTYF